MRRAALYPTISASTSGEKDLPPESPSRNGENVETAALIREIVTTTT
jgi:hypothetical protein